MRLDDVLNSLGNNRDYLILGLAVLVLVEGAIIVLWARRATRLRREVRAAVSAAEAAQAAAEKAVAAAAAAPAARQQREVYSVAGSAPATAPVALAPPSNNSSLGTTVPAQNSSLGTTVPATTPVNASSAPSAPPAASQWTPLAANDVRDEEVLAAPATTPVNATGEVPAGEPPIPEPPAEFVSPAAERAAAWVVPAAPAPAAPNGNGNGHSHTAPTTLGWPETPVPVEPAADFAVVTDPAPAAPPATTPSLTVLEGTKTWSIPATPAPQAVPPAPTHFDPAMFDTNDDDLDDLPTTGDILLVEDDPTIAKLYRVLLESRGYTVRHAGDGLDGLDRANEKRPDLVLLDIMMPRMNGIAFLQALRSGEMREVPVVVLSNFMEKQLVDDAMSLGALEYMVKAQTRPEALVGALPHWLRGERAFSY